MILWRDMLAQYIYNLLIASSKHRGFVYALIFKAAYKVSQILIKISHDPLIAYKIGNFTIHLPLSHPLGIYQADSAFLTNQGRITEYLTKKYQNLSIILVGANVGDSIALIKNYADVPMLAIEGEKTIFSVLKLNCEQFSDVHLVNAFVGEKSEVVKGKLSIYEGTAAFSNIEKRNDLTNVKELGDIVRENHMFNAAKLLMIDTDGFDCKIIRGAAEWLSEKKPIIFFEYDPFHFYKQGDDGISVFQTLSSAGYKMLLLYFNIGDYFCSTSLSNTDFLEEMHEYISGRNGSIYFDMCAFTDEDSDIFDKIRSSEREYFRTARGFRRKRISCHCKNTLA